MSRLLFIVEDSFEVKGRGLVILPGILPVGDENFHVGDPILLMRPDGSQLRTTIGGLELMTPNPRNDVVIMFKNLSNRDITVGTEVWSCSQNE
jgi:hypothetical protein